MRVTVHDPLAFDVLDTGLGFPGGPAVPDDGSVLAVDIEHGTVVRVADGVTTVACGSPTTARAGTPASTLGACITYPR